MAGFVEYQCSIRKGAGLHRKGFFVTLAVVVCQQEE